MEKNKNINRGAAILTIIFALLFFLLAIRFIYIQATGSVSGQVLAAKAEEIYTKKRKIDAVRGSILDRRGEVLAQDTSSFTVVAILDKKMTVDPKDPQHVTDPVTTAQKLAPLLKVKEAELERILSKDKVQVEFGPAGRDITHEQKNKIEKLELPGITFVRDTKRYYPNGTFASHVIGYAQKEEAKDGTVKTVGKMGLEKSLENQLKKQDGYVKYESDMDGLMLPKAKEKIVPPDNGNNVYLTIDQKIQTFLEDSMNKVVKEYSPESIIAIVADPKTGQILAMGTRPSFDPNVRDIKNYVNEAVSYRFEPGSTMKIFTLAAAIEEGVYNGNELFMSGSYKVGPNRVNDHNRTGWGMISFDDGVRLSSNVAFSILAKEKLKTDRLYQYLHKFGLDKPTGIDLQGEETSLINFQYELDKISTAYGQGTAITPIQQIQAATAIANGGKMMKPYIINKIVDPDTDKVVKQNQPVVAGEPISERTAKQVRDLLETVVTSKKGTGKAYFIDGYHVAGKTGTAQIPGPNGKYLSGHGNNIFSFLGMAPKDDPKLLVYVAVKQPKLELIEGGSAPVAAIFNPVMENSLKYLNIKPTAETKTKAPKKESGIVIDDYTGQPAGAVKEELDAKGLKVVMLGDGSVISGQYPQPGEKVISGEKVILRTQGKMAMPNISGWSLRDAMKLAQVLELKLNVIGTGYVYHQNITPKSDLRENDYLIIKLKKPNAKPEETKAGEKEKDKPMD